MTMIVVLATVTGLYMAGDSRQFPVLDDTRQKIQLAGSDVIIGEGGIGVIPGALPNGDDWDALVSLKEIAAQTGKGAFAEQLNSVRDLFGRHFSEALSRYNGEIRAEPPPTIDLLIGKRDDGGRNYVAWQRFKVESAASGDKTWRHTVKLDDPLTKMDGVVLENSAMNIFWNVPYGCNVDVVAAGPIVNGGEAEWLSKFINQTAAQSPECAAQIGGPIRVAVVDQKGARIVSK